jgi:hypothetical protein
MKALSEVLRKVVEGARHACNAVQQNQGRRRGAPHSRS